MGEEELLTPDGERIAVRSTQAALAAKAARKMTTTTIGRNVDYDEDYDSGTDFTSDEEEVFMAEGLTSNNDLSKEQFHALMEVINEAPFADKLEEFGHCTLVQHHIDTRDAKPIKQKPYRETPAKKAFIKKKVKELLDLGVISPSNSPWASPVVIPYATNETWRKERDMRFCVDMRTLNAVTTPDAYPIPRIDEILDALQGASWFVTLDLKSGFWQVELAPEDRHTRLHSSLRKASTNSIEW